MMTKITLICLALIAQAFSWEALPSIPTGRRSQYLVLHENGGYKYGYDTGAGSAAKQSGDSANQVEGHYFYKDSTGQDIDLKYTSGVQGFVPENLDQVLAKAAASAPVGPAVPVVPALPVVSQYSIGSQESSSQDDQAGTGDASYNFNINTDTYQRTESADARGNVQGRYSYQNGAGSHDLSYIAGENTGFVATSGSLATANGLTRNAIGSSPVVPLAKLGVNIGSSSGVNQQNADGSYAFSYSTGDSSRQESADTGNNVQGRYSYQNSAGTHDLSYVAGSGTGFLVTSGSLATPNGLTRSSQGTAYAAPAVPVAPLTPIVPVVTLSPVNPGGVAIVRTSSSAVGTTSQSPDGSYSFAYNAGDSQRQESADAQNNVQGRYAYTNQAGNHDLSYVAGAATGFQVTGGSLSVPNGLTGQSAVQSLVPSSYSVSNPILTNSLDGSSTDDQADTGDASYSFTIDTDEYKRQEKSDASGNVQGSFSYKNGAGTQDLSFVAGSQTGFLPTGGSLSNPESAARSAGVVAPSVPVVPSLPVSPISSGVILAKSSSVESTDDQANTGDSSYSFTVDTDTYRRQESSDASGNVQGSYSYKNAAGDHHLSYVAGSATGFQATGGSLSVAPGLSEAQLRSGSVPTAYSGGLVHQSYSVPSLAQVKSTLPALSVPVVSNNLPATKTSYTLGNVRVHTYLPPSNEKQKYGYVLDTA